MNNKTRECRKQTHRAQKAMEEAKIRAEKTDGKLKELYKQYKGKLRRAGLALKTRLDKSNRMSAERKKN